MRIHFFRQWACRHRPRRRRRRTTCLFFPLPTGTGFSIRSRPSGPIRHGCSSHVRLDHTNLPAQPTAAYVQVAGAVKNLEVQVAGQALVANNLGARLDAVRGDALYATVLFLFLGVPGVALAAALTIAATASGAGRRKLEQALLRVRGATTRRILSLSAAEAMTTGATGVLLGLAGAYLFARLGLQIGGSAWIAVFSAVFAAVAGCIVALAAVLLPAWFASRQETVSAARRTVSAIRTAMAACLAGCHFPGRVRTAVLAVRKHRIPGRSRARGGSRGIGRLQGLSYSGIVLDRVGLADHPDRCDEPFRRTAPPTRTGIALCRKAGGNGRRIVVASGAADHARHCDDGTCRILRHVYSDHQHDIQRTSPCRRGTYQRRRRDRIWNDRESRRSACTSACKAGPASLLPNPCSIASHMSDRTCRTSTVSTRRLSEGQRACPTPISPAEQHPNPGATGKDTERCLGLRGNREGFSAQSWRYGESSADKRE